MTFIWLHIHDATSIIQDYRDCYDVGMNERIREIKREKELKEKEAKKWSADEITQKTSSKLFWSTGRAQ